MCTTCVDSNNNFISFPGVVFARATGVDGVDPEPGASFGLNEAPAGKAKTSNISTMIESQFKSGGTGGWGADPDGKDSVKHEQLMEQYVKERMGDNAGKGGGSSDKEAEDDNTGGGGGRGGMLSEEDRLYTIPEDFKRKVMWHRAGGHGMRWV